MPRLLSILFLCFLMAAQALSQPQTFSRADSLRGALRPERSFDVLHYHLELSFDLENKSIAGYNEVRYVRNDPDMAKLQLDLFEQLRVDSIVQAGKRLSFEREGAALFIDLPKSPSSTVERMKVFYHGAPQIAKMPPWDGGFVWTEDEQGNPWIAVACEGTGASLWWPNKDHLSDEPDSMRITLKVPKGLQAISNGRLIGEKHLEEQSGLTWEVKSPINNYNVTFYIGKYSQISSEYIDVLGRKQNLEHYVIKGHEKEAQKHFEQVGPMLACYEKYFGEYPFWVDGFKLVESPYWGMEHQSAIAYGNQFRNNEFGFDFIIIHESGHEWWGNYVSAADHADMWIHEAFTTYAEAIYVEHLHGKEKAIAYLNTQKPKIANKEPVRGPYHVNYTGWDDADMYYKGTWMLHTLRTLVEDDELWFATLKKLQQEFGHKPCNAEQVISFLSSNLDKDLGAFFAQYLDEPEPPVLEYKFDDGALMYRYRCETQDFDMPLRIYTHSGEQWIFPKRGEWKKLKLSKKERKSLRFDPDHFYVFFEEAG